MFRRTIRDVLWLTVVVVVGFGLLAMAQTSSLATMEGNAFSMVVYWDADWDNKDR
jgi:hypothetical protein